jgi:hypothetical protein
MCLGMCLPVGRTKGEALYVHRSSMASVREKTCNTHFLNKWLQDLWIIIGSIAAFCFFVLIVPFLDQNWEQREKVYH